MIKRLEEGFPDALSLLFSMRRKNIPQRLVCEYKANRPPMPEELRVQIEPIHEIVRAWAYHFYVSLVLRRMT